MSTHSTDHNHDSTLTPTLTVTMKLTLNIHPWSQRQVGLGTSWHKYNSTVNQQLCLPVHHTEDYI